eukprot:TRINITY_DN27323_c0_g1_i1.p1 TRINITY_DN27323_c0_g1~~TRINITY_DN27323_c0_g1_i1.p1  ORF type:complete len:550 (+),score=80.38 TRINITY_DN27323_c0_g1_i1:56-1705(+)
MGIKQLSKLLKKVAAPTLADWHSADEYNGATVAIDASPCMYQCLTVMADMPGQEGDTSHIIGIFKRTVRLLELGIKPIFVFDGEAPDMKKVGEISRRDRMRAKSRELLQDAEAAGDSAAVRRHAMRLVKVTQRHNDEALELLRLMGVPAIQAPSEAECVCSALASSGRADFVATEDLDALVFGAPKVLRFLHQATTRPYSKSIQELSLESVLSAFGFTRPEFIDLCILCGCDYLETIPQVGIHRAHQLITKHRSIEAILQQLDPAKHVVPEGWGYQAVRDWFQAPNVGDLEPVRLQPWPPDVNALRDLLVIRHGLGDFVVDEYIKRLVVVNGMNHRDPATPEKSLRRALFSNSLSTSQVNSTKDSDVGTVEALPGDVSTVFQERSSQLGGIADRSRRRTSRRGSAPSLEVKSNGVAAAAISAELARSGQSTLASCFARASTKRQGTGAHGPNSNSSGGGSQGTGVEEGDVAAANARKRRRAAVDVLTSCLGAGIDFPKDAPVEVLEQLAAQIEATVAAEGGGHGARSVGGGVCKELQVTNSCAVVVEID